MTTQRTVIVVTQPRRTVLITRSPIGLPGRAGDAGPAGAGLELKGWVATVGDLPGDAAVGDAYMVEADGLGYVMGASGWSMGVSLQGPQGEQGEVGPAGPQGATGPAGAKGDTGAQGPQGTQGPAGETGPQGPTGETGAIGAKGDTGAQGPQGVQGPAGAKGDTGAQGPAGETGPQGATGATGPAGPAGAAGPNTVSSTTTVTGLTGVLKVSAGYAAGSATAADVGAEPALGNPGTSGYVLASTDAGVRSWVAQSSGGGVSLGETDTTAYRGDRGKIAYDHSQSAHAPSDATAAGAAGDAFATSHLSAYAHGNIAHGETAYGWGNHASAGYLTSVTYGTTAGTACQGNDSRLSDARTPTTHTHAADSITSGTIATARLGSGSASASTYLRGDSTWATVSGGDSTTSTFMSAMLLGAAL